MEMVASLPAWATVRVDASTPTCLPSTFNITAAAPSGVWPICEIVPTVAPELSLTTIPGFRLDVAAGEEGAAEGEAGAAAGGAGAAAGAGGGGLVAGGDLT